jgi:hypothetical protein
MSKRGVIFILVLSIVMLLPFIYSQTTSDTSDDSALQLDKAYQCIEDKVNNDCSKLTVDEQISAMLANGNYKDCKDSLIAQSKVDADRQCWPKDNCKVKTTAMALLALEKAGTDTTKAKNWLLNQTKIASDLEWYLQIDSSSASVCKITYDSKTYSVSISEDKKLSSGAGNCLSVSESGYWLRISSSTASCLEKSYTIECDKDFQTTLLYKSQSSATIHVSQNINSGVSGGETTEQVIYRCFKTASACDYEGSLWAVIALNKLNIEVNPYLPYLSAFMDDNLILFPETFLYIVTGSDDYLTMVLSNNFKGEYWNIGTYGKFYSTALALMSLQGQDNEQITSAKDYLLNGNTQNSEGCWENIKNTGLLLYAGWPSTSSSGTGDECSNNEDCGDGQTCKDNICVSESSNTDCLSNNHFCIPSSKCSQANKLTGFDCTFTSDICCSVDFQEQTCAQKQGYLCNSNEGCPGTVLSASDYGTCCNIACQEEQPQEEITCTLDVGQCRNANSCLDGEEINSIYTCSNDQVCCSTKSTSSPSYWWIWLLLILIIIVVLAIIFRNKLKLLIFKFKNKFKKGPAPKTTRPPTYPPSASRPIPQRPMRPMFPIQRPMSAPSRPVGKSSKDSEFEETIKKLKEMSK